MVNAAANAERLVHMLHERGEHRPGLLGLAAHVLADVRLAGRRDDIDRDGSRLPEPPTAPDGLVILFIAMTGERDDVVAVLPVEPE